MEIRELIAGLSETSAYPHPVESVEVRQTHISIVFLAGELAYKIKKPVDMGFLDYSTLELRRHFCHEEVRLNRRLAPSVYLGVVPVTRVGQRLKIEGEGSIVEWAVKMERLPDSATLLAHLKRGHVGADAIEELARRLAWFHAHATAGAYVSRGASFEAVARNARENFGQSLFQVGKTLSSATYARLTLLTEAHLDALREIIEKRARRGVPRDTHGDLRLDHVYWFPDRGPEDEWLVIDCIEFDERYRYADPIAELAFLAMELSIEGRRDLAGRFVQAYLHASGDREGRLLLPFYQAYRAAVRAKVEGIKLTEPEVPEADKSAARVRARALWLFALAELSGPVQKPCLVLVGGLPGTGKSTLARHLGALAGFSVIRTDVVRKELLAESGQETTKEPAGEGVYSEDWNDRTYQECLRRAEGILFEGGRVLIDASFRDEARRQLFLDAAGRWGIPACVILCEADAEVVRQRLSQRRGDASDADWSIHAEIAKRWEPLGPETSRVSRTIDTSGTEDEAVRCAFEILRESGLAGR
jgi:aminoglycoside phosphotransferase family enzyme/predicted kinase